MTNKLEVKMMLKSNSLQKAMFLLLLLLGMSSVSEAKSDPAVWSNLSGLHAGQKIQITETNSKKHSGIFVAVTDTDIRLQESAGEITVAKHDVLTVKLSGNRRARNTLIGLGIGAGVGAGVTAAAWESNGFLGNKGTGAVVGLAIGGLTGAIVGAVLPGHKTIYNAEVH
jgi:hypothetical protein